MGHVGMAHHGTTFFGCAGAYQKLPIATFVATSVHRRTHLDDLFTA